MTGDIMTTMSREEFRELSELLLSESAEGKNNISVFTQDGTINFGVDRTVVQVETLAEFHPTGVA